MVNQYPPLHKKHHLHNCKYFSIIFSSSYHKLSLSKHRITSAVIATFSHYSYFHYCIELHIPSHRTCLYTIGRYLRSRVSQGQPRRIWKRDKISTSSSSCMASPPREFSPQSTLIADKTTQCLPCRNHPPHRPCRPSSPWARSLKTRRGTPHIVCACRARDGGSPVLYQPCSARRLLRQNVRVRVRGRLIAELVCCVADRREELSAYVLWVWGASDCGWCRGVG